LALDLDNISVLHGRGSLRFEQAGDAGALEDFDRALAHQPEVLQIYPERSNVCSAMNRHAEALAADPGCTLVLLNKAWTRALTGDPQGGLADAETAFALVPDRPTAQATRAQILSVPGRSDEALQGFGCAMQLSDAPLVEACRRRLAVRGCEPGPADGTDGERTRDALIACIAEACNLLQDP